MSNPIPQPNVPLPPLPQSSSGAGNAAEPMPQTGAVPQPNQPLDEMPMPAPQTQQPSQFDFQNAQNLQQFEAPVAPNYQQPQQDVSQFAMQDSAQYASQPMMEDPQQFVAPQQPVMQEPAYAAAPVQNYQPQPNALPANARPVGQLNTNRSLVKWILLGFITLGIYDIVIMTGATDALNTIASRYDGKKTMHYCLLYFLVGPITFGIGTLVWFHKMSDRVGNELQRRGYQPPEITATTFWLFNALPSFFEIPVLIGAFFVPFLFVVDLALYALQLVYMYKYLDAMNTLCADYNMRG
ncbi:DUF4234 domain-containing protein [Bifidobacterium sp. ESL0775]|uniref:DUF4234 domain-containing protein n=1 Tax=Bifidobacterium sp. ESL0775 TaxID=2983230 RepID=UPI0023F8AFFA|nr:DUF4234 domain-containing protein [Bifidobacterium sp. ESL0775]WEV69881.1 DUF4234 domain-containing protein [Bifidobacterium sp. ESL0775]